MSSLIEMGQRAKDAAVVLATLSTPAKNKALLASADALLAAKAEILAKNKADVDAAVEAGIKGAFIDRLTLTEARLADMAVLIKNVTTYKQTRPIVAQYRKAKDKEKYRTAHESDIILYEAAAKAIKAAGITKLPSLAALQAEYAALQEQKEALYADYGKLKKQVKEYDVIKKNIDSILKVEHQPEREKEAERG